MPPGPPESTIAAGPWRSPRIVRIGGPLLFAGALTALFLVLAGIGLAEGIAPTGGMIAAASVMIAGSITPALYLLGALGLGRPLAAALARGSADRTALQLALGLGWMLWLSHLLGVLGLLSEAGPLGPLGSRLCGWGTVVLGIVLLGDQVFRGNLRPERWPVFPVALITWTPALALLAVAAANPPLGLWESEFAGYDALSYHLQLAKEWAAGPQGRLWPVEHNVYSFLPSYMEAAFVHLGAMSPGPTGGQTGGGAITRMLGGEAHWVYSCQILHAGVGLVAAILVASLVRRIGEDAGADRAIAAFGGVAAGALLLSTPWTIVVGSLAYNELAMLAGLAGAMLAAVQREPGLWRRSAATGMLVGIACSAKPTALLLAGPAIGIALLAWHAPFRPRQGARMVAAGAAGGLVAIAPWLIRNALASGGNPVFPFAALRLGLGHWTSEQAARYARAHTTDLGIGERLVLLFSRSGSRAGVAGGQARGLGHEQWSIVPWLALASVVIVLLWRPTRRAGAILWIGSLLTLAAWGALTHIQSRFLLPLLVPMSAAFGLATCAVLTVSSRRAGGQPDAARVRPRPWLASILIGVLPLTVAGWSVIQFMRQYQGRPNRLLVLGAGGLTGALFGWSLRQAPDSERRAFLENDAQPPVMVNLGMRQRGRDFAPDPGEPAGLYLLGDAAPLYYLDALGPPRGVFTPSTGTVLRGNREWSAIRVDYHTTWDRSPLGEAIGAAPDEPVAWTRWMRGHGYGFVLVNYAELMRLIEKDRNFDPRVTLEAVDRWLRAGRGPQRGLTSLRRWLAPVDPSGRVRMATHELFRIDPPEAADDPATRTGEVRP